MKIKLNKLPLSKKVYEVKRTVKNMRLTYDLQLTFARVSDFENQADEEVLDNLLDSLNTALEYIQKVLKLSDEDMEKIEDQLEQDDVFEITNLIAMKLMGVKETDIPSKEEQKSNKSAD